MLQDIAINFLNCRKYWTAFKSLFKDLLYSETIIDVSCFQGIIGSYHLSVTFLLIFPLNGIKQPKPVLLIHIDFTQLLFHTFFRIFILWRNGLVFWRRNWRHILWVAMRTTVFSCQLNQHPHQRDTSYHRASSRCPSRSQTSLLLEWWQTSINP